MKKVRSNWKWLVVGLALLTLLAACGGDDEPTPTTAPVATVEVADVEATTAPEAADQPDNSAADYQDMPWLWVGFSDPVEGSQDIPDPDRYQLVLNSDGTVNVTADCNMVSGTYTADAGSIMIELGPSTLAACPEDSLGDQFVQNLTAARIMFFQEDEMFFDLFADAGTMRFNQAGGSAPEISQPISLWGAVADQTWVLVGFGDALNPTVVEEGTVVTVSFSSTDGQVSGSGGCNNYFTSYESTDEGGLTINSPIGSTLMACDEGGELEIAYFGALENVNGWNLTDQGRLVLAYDSGQQFEEELIYIPGETPLTGTDWRLVSYGDPDQLQQVLEGTTVTAVFTADSDTAGTVEGNATCNSYSTSYTIEEDQISFSPIAGTLMACPIGAEQEQAYLAALESAQTYQIFGPNLQITYQGGVLNFTSLDLPLENVLWQAEAIDDELVPEDVEITAVFTPGDEAGSGNVGGTTGCNSYNSGYETSSDMSTDPPSHTLIISTPMAVTGALCSNEDLADLEAAYLAGLESIKAYEIEGDRLTVFTGTGSIIYVADRQPLLGTLWTLVSLGAADNPQPPIEGSAFTALFNRPSNLPTGTVTGGTGCNEYEAAFTSNLSEIKVNLPDKTQNEECPWGNNFEVEQQYFLALNAAREYRVLGDTLQIPYGEGVDRQVLNFTTGQPEDREFLDLSPLDGTFWYLSSIGTFPVLPYTQITAGFEIQGAGATGTVNGSSGCNPYSATISGAGGALSVGPIAATKRACPTDVMNQEGGYFDWLSKTSSFELTGEQLLLTTANGVLTYQSTPVLNQSQQLQNVTWYLVSAGTLPVVSGSGATSFFATDGRSLSGVTGCNNYTGTYNAQAGNALAISGLTTTQAACATEALTKQQEALLIFLQSAVSYTIIDTSLQIQTVDGSTINYTSVAPTQPVGPTAAISGPQLVDTGQLLTFDGSGSTAGSQPIARYDWDMGNGALLSGVSVQYSYNEPGSFTVKLTVTDQAGLTSEATQQVEVRPVVDVEPPTAVIEGPGQALVGQPVTFSAAGSTQGTAAITGYVWQSGDGNNTEQVTENTFTTIYAQPGTFQPSLTVVDAGGLSDSASITITINANLVGTTWILGSALPGTSISLLFSNDSLSGFGGCNNYNAAYTTTSEGSTNGLTVGPISSTQQACTEEIMAQEQTYLTNLASATNYTISGATLTITTAAGPLTFGAAVATPLPA